MKNANIALIYIDRPYLSPTESQLFYSLSALPEVRIVNVTELLRSDNEELLDEYKNIVDDASCIFISNYVPNCIVRELNDSFFSTVRGKCKTIEPTRKLLKYIYALNKPKIASCLLYDIHDPDFSSYLSQYGKDGIVIGCRFKVPEQDDTFDVDNHAVHDNARVAGNCDAIIEAPHCIAAHEFCSMQTDRPWKIAIPGITYKRRAIAHATLDTALRLFGPPFMPVYGVLKATGLILKATGWAQPQFMAYYFANYYHRKILSMTKILYTDGSMVDYAVRKFFEIPAAGCLLLCTPFNGMSDLGFKDGVTHIECAPEDVGKLVRTIDVNTSKIRDIIKNGQDLVRQKHSSDARARQLAEAMRRVASGTLKSAHWYEGEYIFS